MDQYPETLSHLLSSNLAPQPLEIEYIQHELTRLNESIDRLQIQLRSLEEKRQRYQALLSPLRRMPLELLGEIFGFTVSPENAEQDRKGDKLIALSLVSRVWRDGALAAHRLWGDLEVKKCCYTFPMLEKIKVWLDRSKNCPKSLKLHVPEHKAVCTIAHRSLPPSSPEGPLAALLTDGPTLHRLSLSFPDGDCFRQLTLTMEQIKARKPTPLWDSLPSLGLEFRMWPQVRPFDVDTMSSDDTFSRLPPGITSFDLRLHPGPFVLPRLTPNLWIYQPIADRFITLRLEVNGEATSALMALRHCTNLETLIFDFREYSFKWKDTPSNVQLKTDGISLPKLRTLRLEHAMACDDFLSFLMTPLLSELDMSFQPIVDPFSDCQIEEAQAQFATEIISLVERSNCKLLRLRIHHLSFRENSDKFILETIVSNLPALTHLTLDAVAFDGHLEDIRYLRNTQLLPRLEVFELLNIPLLLPFFDHVHIGEFIDGRYPDKRLSKDSLRRFVLTYKRPVELEDPEHPMHPSQLEHEFSGLRRFQGIEVNFGFSSN